MKQTLIRFLLIVLFYLLFRYVSNITYLVVSHVSVIALLYAFVCTYIIEPFVTEQLNK